MSYTPRFNLTNKMVSLVASIGEQIGRLSVPVHSQPSKEQSKAYLMDIIQGMLAIEGSQLSRSQVAAILEGKQMVASGKEIQEIKNVLAVYAQLDSFQFDDQKSLLSAHKKLMFKLIDEDKQNRWGSVGVIKNNKIIHIAPPVHLVPKLMNDLFIWLQESDVHPLIKSCVMNYELDTIHPFSDGNGRIGRLWQRLILKQYGDVFTYLPFESLIAIRQSKFNKALTASTKLSDCAPFIEFMLEIIDKALQIFEYQDTLKTSITPQVTLIDKDRVSAQVDTLIKLMISQQKKHAINSFKREELQQLLGLSDKKSFIQRYLKPALKAGIIVMTIPDKPTSRSQAYQLTQLGNAKD
jgi:Fic family protein